VQRATARRKESFDSTHFSLGTDGNGATLLIGMVGKVKPMDHHLLRRRCVCCGYDGPAIRLALQRDAAADCPECGCDYHQRPPRSYAEMEGLLARPVPFTAPVISAERQQRLIHRWLAFLFVTLIGIIALGYLAAAAMAV